MHLTILLSDIDVDPETRKPMIYFTVIADTGTAIHRGQFGVVLSAYALSSAAKRSAGQAAITAFLQQQWGLTVDGSTTWEVYGV